MNSPRPQTVIAMCGIAFSGKSTAARKIAAALDLDLIVLDAINDDRGMSGGAGMTPDQWNETSLIAMDRLRAALARGRSVVVDDTFSHRFLRDRCKAVADEFGCAFEILFVDTPLIAIQLRRTANNASPIRPQVRDDVFDAHQKQFQFPADDEPIVRVRDDHDLDRWIADYLRGRSTRERKGGIRDPN
jgi:predicted kinase